MTDSITIRRAETPADYRACQEAQRRAWGITEDGYVIPVATMAGAQHHGGLVLGVFLPSGEAVGLSFAFLGRIGGRVGLYSQLTGVVPGYQGRGLGLRLKHAQRDFAREQGLPVIAWAFDPLQAGNAHFNLGRLGATVSRYVDDMYGPRTDGLNAGVPTDRVVAEWETELKTRSPREHFRILRWPRLLVNAESEVCFQSGLAFEEDAGVLLEIPRHVGLLRRDDPARAEDWRRVVREAFREAFAAGFRAVDFVRDERSDPPRGFYVLERDLDG